MSLLLENGANRLEADDAVLAVSGEVDFDGAADLAAAGRRWLAERSPGSHVIFDLGGVDRVSSAAISVLLEWTRQSRASRLELETVRLSTPLARLTRVAGLDSLLPVEAPAEACEE
ncbi:STAS domain-containing protein [Halomonas organivorans]|uniref:Phospholipid transport system transporter-binding protein n=1 Tax=Halomonas organivorans TaxID=257772 RepID=A0A7W5C302_9GAMM|nr:STAS domain-containing protein [Halomonas organivorans]MBB3143393.1 phospholipid transport system transporter-binding protein [Halomonas organivorans]